MNWGTPTATRALGVIGLLVLVAVSWMFVLGPAVASLGAAGEKRETTEDLNLSMATQLASLQSLADDVPAMRRAASKLMDVVPPTADQPGFFRAVTAAAEDAGIRAAALTSVSPGVPVLPEAPPPPAPEPAPAGSDEDVIVAPVVPAPDPTTQLAVQEVGINVQGTYDELRRLLANLETMQRALLLSSVDLSADAEALTMTVTGSSFVASPLGDPPTMSE